MSTILPYDVVDLLCGNSFPVLRVDRPVDKRGFRLFFYFIVKVAVRYAQEVISLAVYLAENFVHDGDFLPDFFGRQLREVLVPIGVVSQLKTRGVSLL